MKTKVKRQSSPVLWPATARRLASGALAIYSAVGCSVVFAAQTVPGKESGAVEAAVLSQIAARRFDIAAGPLGEASDAFSRMTGITIVFQQDGLRQLASPGVVAVTTPERALDTLTQNTGVQWRFTNPRSVTIELASVAQTVSVSDTVLALPESTPKFTEPLLDTPQTIDVIGQKTMQEQQVTTLRDALRNVAGISIAAGEGGAQGDNLTIRGFSARNDLYIDGMRDFGSYYRDPFDLDEVEVLQGPDSTNFGRGSTGGVVNQATKFPMVDRMFSGTFDAGTDGTRRLVADLNAPFKVKDTPSAFRLNLMGDEGGVAGRPVAHN